MLSSQAMAKRRTTDLQIRGIPVALRDNLRRRAARKGVSMSQYVVQKLRADLERPSLDEWLDDLRTLRPVDLGGLTGADLVREGREEDDAEDERPDR